VNTVFFPLKHKTNAFSGDCMKKEHAEATRYGRNWYQSSLIGNEALELLLVLSVAGNTDNDNTG